MFFAIDLLCPQHDGKFSIAWICATRGARYINRQQITNCNVIKLCDEILELILNSSNRAKSRLSLSLGSRLINGMVKIYRLQVIFLQNDIAHFIQQIRRPAILSASDHDGNDLTEPMVQPKVLKKRKRKVIVSQIIQIEPEQQLQDGYSQVIAVEAVLSCEPNNEVNEDHSNAVLDIVREGDDDGIVEGATPAVPDFISKTSTPLQEPVGPKTPTKRIRSRIKSVAPIETVLRRDEEEAILHAPVQEVIQPPIIELTEFLIEEPTEQPVKEVDIARLESTNKSIEQLMPPVPEVVEEGIVQTLKRKKNVKDTPITRTLIKIRSTRTVNINRCEENDLEFFDLWDYENRVSITLTKVEDPDKLIRPFLRFLRPLLDENDPLLSNVQEPSRVRSSLLRSCALSRMECRDISSLAQVQAMHTPLQISEQHQLAVTVDVHPPPPSKKRKIVAIEEQINEEPILPPQISDVPVMDMQPVAESTRLTNNLDEIIATGPKDTIEKELPPFIHDVQHMSFVLPDRTIETELPLMAEAQKRKQKILDVRDEGVYLKRNRLKNIRHIVQNWDFENQGSLTIEDVCNEPINRLNIATTFNDLLSLHKMGYVNLTSKSGTLELGAIEKGAKLR